jgi:hypothetical protein
VWRRRIRYDTSSVRRVSFSLVSNVIAKGLNQMSLEYLLTTGALVVGFLVILKLLMDALVGSMAIKSFLFSLPVG